MQTLICIWRFLLLTVYMTYNCIVSFKHFVESNVITINKLLRVIPGSVFVSITPGDVSQPFKLQKYWQFVKI